VKLLPLLLLLPTALFAQDDVFEDDWGDDWDDEETRSVWSGFAEAGLGVRLGDDPVIDSTSTLEDLRLRVESEWQAQSVSIALKADLAYDGVENAATGDVRDLTAAFSIGKSTDFKIGRQVQTWGTGDLVFLNDLFPKDFVSFFAGRDDEYLKAPGNAIRVTRFSKTLNVDFAWTPVFTPDIYLTGERFSFFSPIAGGNVAPNPPLSAVKPSKSLANGEFALRLFRTVEGREFALYAYHGFFKQPTALTPSLQASFAPLTAIGGSVRRPFGPGLLNAEVSYYASRDDRSGTNPLLPNDQFRFLTGYEWEAKPRLTVGLQYYLEWTMNHDELIANSPFPEFEPSEFRHLLTNRLTYRTPRDRHSFSLFTFLSPSDRDVYLRPVYTYRHSDQWSISAGGNLFGGDEPQTFFNQLRDASNAYVRLRFSY
jgi:hypothetical protein